MRLIASPEFKAKLSNLNVSEGGSLLSFFDLVESANDKHAILNDSESALSLGEDIYVHMDQQTRVFFSFGNDDDGEYLLLLDITTKGPKGMRGNLFSTKNPKTNSAVNPRRNSSINPRINSSINPRINSSINPRINSSINPRINSSINPRINSSINPRINSSINPRINSSINPRINSSINPRRNAAFGGPYLYNHDQRNVGYLVKANEDVELVFELSGDFSGYLVAANEEVRVQFDTSNQWVGFVVRANEEVSLRYTTSGEWVGTIS